MTAPQARATSDEILAAMLLKEPGRVLAIDKGDVLALVRTPGTLIVEEDVDNSAWRVRYDTTTPQEVLRAQDDGAEIRDIGLQDNPNP